MSVIPFQPLEDSESSSAASEPIRSDSEQEIVKTWQPRIQEARKARAPYEPGWLQCLAFAAGEQYQVWDRDQRSLILPDLKDGEERYAADKIMQYRNTALGELTGDDDRPELQFLKEDVPSERFTETANLGLEYGWDAEWRADARLMEAKRTAIDLGTAAVRTRFDPTVGPVRLSVPHLDGRPLLNPEEARAAVIAAAERGEQIEFRDIHEGRTGLDVLSPLNLLVPPAIADHERFPWEIVVWPEYIDRLKEEYGPAADGLVEDSDIASVFALGGYGPETPAASEGGKLKDHVWVYSCYERPCQKYPKGRVVVLASNNHRVLAVRDELPYKGPDGSYRSGITYFHWWRITGRFWGKSLVEALKDPQRSINRRTTQVNEIIDRGMPFAIEEEGSIVPRQGKPLETVRVKAGSAKPEFHSGIGAGEYMYRDIERLRQDLEEAAGIRGVSLGENPASVTNFSQLALLRENDQIKLKPTISEIRAGIREIVENCVYDMRRYWGAEKMLRLEGADGMARAAVFNATEIPVWFMVKVAKGAPKPHGQAANLQMIQDIARYSAEAAQPLPVKWLAESLKAGQPQPLPEMPDDDQRQKALHENMLMVAGRDVPVAYYDPPLIHIPEHRSMQIQAEAAGDMELWQRLEKHVREHLMVEEAKAAQQGAPPAAA